LYLHKHTQCSSNTTCTTYSCVASLNSSSRNNRTDSEPLLQTALNCYTHTPNHELRQKSSWYPLSRKMGGPNVCFGCFGVQKSHLHLPRIKPGLLDRPRAGIAQSILSIRYSQDGPGIEFRWGQRLIFCTRPDQPWGPSSLLCDGYRVITADKEAGACL